MVDPINKAAGQGPIEPQKSVKVQPKDVADLLTVQSQTEPLQAAHNLAKAQQSKAVQSAAQPQKSDISNLSEMPSPPSSVPPGEISPLVNIYKAHLPELIQILEKNATPDQKMQLEQYAAAIQKISSVPRTALHTCSTVVQGLNQIAATQGSLPGYASGLKTMYQQLTAQTSTQSNTIQVGISSAKSQALSLQQIQAMVHDMEGNMEMLKGGHVPTDDHLLDLVNEYEALLSAKVPSSVESEVKAVISAMNGLRGSQGKGTSYSSNWAAWLSKGASYMPSFQEYAAAVKVYEGYQGFLHAHGGWNAAWQKTSNTQAYAYIEQLISHCQDPTLKATMSTYLKECQTHSGYMSPFYYDEHDDDPAGFLGSMDKQFFSKTTGVSGGFKALKALDEKLTSQQTAISKDSATKEGNLTYFQQMNQYYSNLKNTNSYSTVTDGQVSSLETMINQLMKTASPGHQQLLKKYLAKLSEAKRAAGSYQDMEQNIASIRTAMDTYVMQQPASVQTPYWSEELKMFQETQTNCQGLLKSEQGKLSQLQALDKTLSHLQSSSLATLNQAATFLNTNATMTAEQATNISNALIALSEAKSQLPSNIQGQVKQIEESWGQLKGGGWTYGSGIDASSPTTFGKMYASLLIYHWMASYFQKHTTTMPYNVAGTETYRQEKIQDFIKAHPSKNPRSFLGQVDAQLQHLSSVDLVDMSPPLALLKPEPPPSSSRYDAFSLRSNEDTTWLFAGMIHPNSSETENLVSMTAALSSSIDQLKVHNSSQEVTVQTVVTHIKDTQNEAAFNAAFLSGGAIANALQPELKAEISGLLKMAQLLEVQFTNNEQVKAYISQLQELQKQEPNVEGPEMNQIEDIVSGMNQFAEQMPKQSQGSYWQQQYNMYSTLSGQSSAGAANFSKQSGSLAKSAATYFTNLATRQMAEADYAKARASGNESLADLFKSAILDHYMPDQEAKLKNMAEILEFQNFGANYTNKLLNDMVGFGTANNDFNFNSMLKGPSAGVYNGTPSSASAYLSKEKTTLAARLASISKAQKDLSQIQSNLSKQHFTKTQMSQVKKELTNIRNNLAAAKKNLGALKATLDDVKIGSVSGKDNEFTVTSISGNQHLVKDIGTNEGRVINGVAVKGSTQMEGGLVPLQSTVNGYNSNYSNQSQSAQMELQMTMTEIQQEWTVVSTSLQLLNQAYMTFAQGIRSS